MNKSFLSLCAKVDSEPSPTPKIVLFAKLVNDFKTNYFCKNLHTRRLTGFLWELILHHIIYAKYLV